MKKLFISLILFYSFLFSQKHSFSVQNKNSFGFQNFNYQMMSSTEEEQRYFDDLPPHLDDIAIRERNSVNITELLSWGEFQEHTYEAMVKIDDQTLAYSSWVFNEDDESYPALIIDDVSDPLNPQRISALGLSGFPSWGSFKIKDNYLFACNSFFGLDIIDISDLSNPVMVSHYDYYYADDPYLSARIYDIAFSGDIAFLACRQGGVKVLDILDPSNPIDLNTYFSSNGNYIDAVEIVDNNLIFGDRSGNVTLLDISNIYSPEVLSEINIGDHVWDLNVSGNVIDALVLYPFRYAKIIYSENNISLANDILELGCCYSYSFTRSGDFVYIPDENRFIKIHSPLSNNDDLSVDSSIDLFSINPFSSDIINEKLYISSGSGYVIHDLSTNEYIGGNFNYDGSVGDVYANDSLIIVNDNISNAVKIFTFDNTGELDLKSEIQNEWVSYQNSIYVQNDNLLLLSENRIIWYDITDINNPIFVDDYYGSSDGYGLKIAFTSEFFVAGKLVYDQGTYGNFDVLKLSDNGEIEFLNYLFMGGTYDDFYNGELSLIGDPVSNKIFLLNQKSGDQTELREITADAISSPSLEGLNINTSAYGEYSHDIDQGILYLLSNSDFLYRIDLSNPTEYISLPVLADNEMVSTWASRIDIEYPYFYYYNNQQSDTYNRGFYIFDLSQDNEWVGFHEDITEYFEVDSKNIFNYLGAKGLKVYQFDESQLPNIEVSIDSLSFLATSGNTDSKSIHLTNTSNSVDLEIFDATLNNSVFSIENEIPLVIEPLGTVEIIIHFEPNDLPYGYGAFDYLILENNSVNLPNLYIHLNGFVDILQEPKIISIFDIPEDQGGQVRISFEASKWDIMNDYSYFFDVGDPGDFYNGIQSYSIWRKLDEDSWDAIGSFNAIHDSIYHFVAPTLCDSTVLNGDCWSTFRVSAHYDANVFWISQQDSGYSVDNIAPSIPTNFTIAAVDDGFNLYWDEVQDLDFQYYLIDKSADSLFQTLQYPSFQTTENSFLDSQLETGVIVYYRVSALDHSGNKSGYSIVMSSENLGTDPYFLPESFALHQNYPNPFNPITSLSYDLPNDGLVNITVYDMTGRVVKTLVNSTQTAGFKTIQWSATNDRNEPVSAGLYLYTIQAGEFRQTKKMVLLK